MSQVEFHPDAVAEARSPWQWYAERSPLAASAFLAELDRAITLVSEGPYQWRSTSLELAGMPFGAFRSSWFIASVLPRSRSSLWPMVAAVPAIGDIGRGQPNQLLQLPGRPSRGRRHVQVTMSGVWRTGVAGPQLSSTVRLRLPMRWLDSLFVVSVEQPLAHSSPWA